jgi:anti-sigma regulatory factor (Ser/Thr protein kinase)
MVDARRDHDAERSQTAGEGVSPPPSSSRHEELFLRAEAAAESSAELAAAILGGARRQLTLTLPSADLSAPRTARDAVAELARRSGGAESQVEAVRLIVSEAVTNVVRHAYDDRPGTIEIQAAIVGRNLVFVVADDGHGPHVPSRDPGLGMGWKLVARLADRLTILERATGGTELRISLRLVA